MIEHTVGWRCARSVEARCALLTNDLATTDWDEPVSTIKVRAGPWPNRERTSSETSPGVSTTVSGTVVPTSPWVKTADGAGPVGPCTSGGLACGAGPSRAAERQVSAR